MNSLKSLFFLAVLAAAACGLYVSLNRNTEPPLPAGLAQSGQNGSAVTNPPKVEIPGTAPAWSPPAAANPPSAPTLPSIASASAGLPPSTASRAAPVAPPAGPSPPAIAAARPLAGSPLPSESASRFNSSSETAQARTSQIKIESIMQSVETKLDERQFAEAHLLLSSIYDSPDVPPAKAKEIVQLLDQMAGMVIYSRQHLLESAYRVQQGDTLERIAELYSVPPELLARINGIRDPRNLTPGRELKVVRGPFSALVSLDRQEMTLMLQGRYAGRFPITTGLAVLKAQGKTLTVHRKYSDPSAQVAPGLYIDLGDGVIMQVSVPNAAGGQPSRPGEMIANGPPAGIGLGVEDLNDVHGILSVGSKVTIQR